jgi:hypothetical protein
LSVVGAAGATAQTCPGSGGSGGSGSGTNTCASTTTSPILNTTPTTVSGLALTGEQAALPLAAAAGIIVLVLGARQLRRRANN